MMNFADMKSKTITGGVKRAALMFVLKISPNKGIFEEAVWCYLPIKQVPNTYH